MLLGGGGGRAVSDDVERGGRERLARLACYFFYT